LGDDMAIYRRLPWGKTGVICNDEEECYLPEDLTEKEVEEKQ